MVCVDRDNFKCCCGCDLTVATFVFGILSILSGLSSLGFLATFAPMGVEQVSMGIYLCCVLCRKKNIDSRKEIYDTYRFHCILLVSYTILAIV